MFLAHPRMPERWDDEPPKRRKLSGREEKALFRLLGLNLLMLLVAPIGGASILELGAWLIATLSRGTAHH